MQKKSSVKYKTWILTLLIPLFSIMLFSLAKAQGVLENPVKAAPVATFFANLFGLTGLATWGEFIMVLLVFVMFFFAFSDIIENFTLFSKRTSWVIGFVLAVIGALTKGVLGFAHFLIVITAWAGAISIFIAIITAFIAFAIIHLASSKIGGFMWAAKRQKVIAEAKKKGISAGSTIAMLEELGKSSK